MHQRRKLLRTGATLVLLVAGLVSMPAMLERLDGAASGAANSADALSRSLGLAPPGAAGADPTVIASKGRVLTSAQRRALLEQAIANAPIPLSDDPDRMTPADASAAALQQRLRSALARVELDN